MNVEFVITNYGKFNKEDFSGTAQDVAFQFQMPMPPRAGETISGTLCGEDYDGRHALLEVSSVQYVENKGTSVDSDVGAICHCYVKETWIRAPHRLKK